MINSNNSNNNPTDGVEGGGVCAQNQRSNRITTRPPTRESLERIVIIHSGPLVGFSRPRPPPPRAQACDVVDLSTARKTITSAALTLVLGRDMFKKGGVERRRPDVCR